MEIIKLNNKEYYVKPDEFIIQPHAEYNNLRIYPKVGELERIIGLLNDLVEHTKSPSLAVYGWKYGGFVPIRCSSIYENVYVYPNEYVPKTSNIPSNIIFNEQKQDPSVIFIDEMSTNLYIHPKAFVLCNVSLELPVSNFIRVPIHDTDLILNVPQYYFTEFNLQFRYYFDDNGLFKYDNLIHLCIMVKNAGPLFEKVLTENLSIIDRWTILDTGSTDGTQDIIRKVLKDKKGKLYEEPFINFRESRNRCLDLAGKNCKYLVMLDDTYAIRGDLRQFLNVVRGDQFASSYSLLILSDDVEYYSNRVTISERGLRYIYTIHEVITDVNNKENVVIPKHASNIHDHRAPYMEKRTMDRKKYDLQLLHDMVRDDPTNPRHYYYLAQTYNLLEDYENAAVWFRKRAFTELKGHDQEAVDSCFELARIYNFKLNKPWDECKELYEKTYELDKSRPEALYFIGIHYHLQGDTKTSYQYFKNAFQIGYPIHAQFSLKPTLSFHFLPKFLAPICYDNNEYTLGLEACKLYMEHNNQNADQYQVMQSWLAIFKLLVTIPKGPHDKMPKPPNKPNIVFVADGNWNAWTGSDILTKGLGGSETYIVEIARWVQATGKFNTYVFCNCLKSEIFENVIYLPLSSYSSFIFDNYVHTCIVSRYSEYVPLTIQGFVDNIYLVLHDLGPTGIIIPLHHKLKKVLCLTKWHEEYFLNNFPSFKGRTDSFYYGIDQTRFKPALKVRNSFIYSSFPNRGLLPLLQMWPAIKRALPDATLNVYSNIDGEWVNRVAKEQMDEIRRLLKTSEMKDVIVHGWVSKSELADAWSKASVWFYPCIFQETFCLTALEAAASKTLAISVPLAALQETVGDRGILLDGNPMDTQWQENAVKEVLNILHNYTKHSELIERNYEWANSISWKQRGEEFAKKYIDIHDSYLGDMGNWVDDLPANSGEKKLFEQALLKANPKRILEIGTYSGRSLIEMLKRYPQASGVAIDSWKSYEEEGLSIIKNIEINDIESLFHNNVKLAGMSNRVTALKGDSVDKLSELLARSEKFDFIYVDGSHTCLDCYADMILGWKLLVPGGVMAVDDVLYRQDKVNEGDLLGYPLKAKEHFMTKFAGQYEVISDSYRLFIQKL